MADDINPALRSELEAAKSALEPQIRGLHDLAATSISSDLRNEVLRQIEIRERRMLRLQAVVIHLDSAVEARDALERDGYPEVEDSTLPEGLFAELAGENADLDAAASIFKAESAQNLSITLGAPAPKLSKEKT